MTSKKFVTFLIKFFVNVAKNIGENSIPVNSQHPSITKFQENNITHSIVCACAILKDRPVCYGTSRLKNRVCAVMRCALLKTPTLKSNKR